MLVLNAMTDDFISADDCEIVLPVANMRREDLQLRRDIGFVLDCSGIDTRAMTFLDEVPLSDWHRDGRLQLVLVDHNELSFRHQYLDADVVAIFDHHRDHLAANPDAKAAACSRMQPRIIDGLVASACSLVVNHFIDVHDPDALNNPTVAFLVLSTLLLDSHGFNPQVVFFHISLAGAHLIWSVAQVLPIRCHPPRPLSQHSGAGGSSHCHNNVSHSWIWIGARCSRFIFASLHRPPSVSVGYERVFARAAAEARCQEYPWTNQWRRQHHYHNRSRHRYS